MRTDMCHAMRAAKVLGITIEIVKRPAEQKGFVLLPRRWVVERTIAWINHCRRLSKEFERHTKNSVAWILLGVNPANVALSRPRSRPSTTVRTQKSVRGDMTSVYCENFHMPS
jgi:hypothetical protein